MREKREELNAILKALVDRCNSIGANLTPAEFELCIQAQRVLLEHRCSGQLFARGLVVRMDYE